MDQLKELSSYIDKEIDNIHEIEQCNQLKELLSFVNKEMDSLTKELREIEKWDDHDMNLAIRNQITAYNHVKIKVEWMLNHGM